MAEGKKCCNGPGRFTCRCDMFKCTGCRCMGCTPCRVRNSVRRVAVLSVSRIGSSRDLAPLAQSARA